MAVQKISDFKPDVRFQALFISKSGDGKSTAAASFPEAYHELDPDLRFGGIAGSVKQGIIKNKNISYEQFRPGGGWEPIGKCLDQLQIYRMQAASNQMAFPYKTIGLGSLGSLERIIMNLARREINGRVIVGGIRVSAPGDQKIANSGIHQVIDTLQDMPCNIICTAHLVDKWGKPKSGPNNEVNKEDVYKPNEIIGERLNLNDNLAESVTSRFDNVFRFDRDTIANKIKYTVEFSGDLAKNSYGIPPGHYDWTDKDFYSLFIKIIGLVNDGANTFEKLNAELKK